MDYKHLHEIEIVELRTTMPRSVSELFSVFKTLGFTLHDDVVSLDRHGRIPPWQHKSVVEVEVSYQGQEVFEFDDGDWDTIRLKYLFASLPYELVDRFTEIVFKLSDLLEIPAEFEDVKLNPVLMRMQFDQIRDDLFSETGEDAGSERLAILIHRTYPRK